MTMTISLANRGSFGSGYSIRIYGMSRPFEMVYIGYNKREAIAHARRKSGLVGEHLTIYDHTKQEPIPIQSKQFVDALRRMSHE